MSTYRDRKAPNTGNAEIYRPKNVGKYHYGINEPNLFNASLSSDGSHPLVGFWTLPSCATSILKCQIKNWTLSPTPAGHWGGHSFCLTPMLGCHLSPPLAHSLLCSQLTLSEESFQLYHPLGLHSTAEPVESTSLQHRAQSSSDSGGEKTQETSGSR